MWGDVEARPRNGLTRRLLFIQGLSSARLDWSDEMGLYRKDMRGACGYSMQLNDDQMYHANMHNVPMHVVPGLLQIARGGKG